MNQTNKSSSKPLPLWPHIAQQRFWFEEDGFRMTNPAAELLMTEIAAGRMEIKFDIKVSPMNKPNALPKSKL